jgi:hypothetical protein
MYPEESKERFEWIFAYLHSRLIHNSQKAETTQKSIDE